MSDDKIRFNKLGWLVLVVFSVSATASATAARRDPIKVLAPWTPMKYQGGTLRVWGREYGLGNTIFPRQITSGGRSLLAGPISLKCQKMKKTLPDTLHRVVTLLLSPGEVNLREDISFGSHVNAIVSLRAEYDGLLVYHVHLSSQPTVTIDNLSLEIPLNAGVATFFQKYILMNKDWGEQATRSIPSREGIVWQSPFNPYVWIGNENEGLFWFSQSSTEWRTASPPLRFVRSRDGLKFIISFVNRPTVVAHDLDFEFGLQATPTRPLPRRWRSIKIIRTWPSRKGLSLAALGTNPKPAVVILWPNNKEWQWFGFPEPRNAERMKALIHSFHSRGIKVVPYVQAEALASNMPAYKANIAAWQYLPPVIDNFSLDVLAMRGPIHAVNPASGWEKFFLQHLQKFLNTYDVDGLYLDNIYLYPDTNRLQYPAGTVYPILALRRLLRNTYAMVKAKNSGNLVMIHMSGHDLTPAISYSDVILDGEDVASRPWTCRTYQKMLNLEEFQGEFAGRQWGPTPMFLSTLGYKKGCLNSYRQSEYVLAYALVHGDRLWGEFKDNILERVYQVYKQFGVADAWFVPYWNASNDVRIITANPTTDQDVKVSLYLREGQGRARSALLVVANLSPSATSAEIKSSLATLGEARLHEAKIYSFDARTHELDQRLHDNTLQLGLRGYSFKLVWIHSMRVKSSSNRRGLGLSRTRTAQH